MIGGRYLDEGSWTQNKYKEGIYVGAVGTSVRNTLWCSPHSSLWIKLSVERKWLSHSHKKANVEGINDALKHLQKICTVYNASCNVWSHVSTPLWRKLKIRSDAHWCEKSHWVKVENWSHWNTVEKCFPWIFCDTTEWVTGPLWKMSDTIFSIRSQMAKTFRLCLFSHKQQSTFLHSALRDSVNLQYVSWIYDVRRNKATQPVQQMNVHISDGDMHTHLLSSRWKMKAGSVSHGDRPRDVTGCNLSWLWFSNTALTSSCTIHSSCRTTFSWTCETADTFIQGLYLYVEEYVTPIQRSWVQCVFYVQDNRVALIF